VRKPAAAQRQQADEDAGATQGPTRS
jgi:hypothetical protein